MEKECESAKVRKCDAGPAVMPGFFRCGRAPPERVNPPLGKR
jgi:hypothetical protein